MDNNHTNQHKIVAKTAILILVISGIALTTFNTSITIKYTLNTEVSNSWAQDALSINTLAN